MTKAPKILIIEDSIVSAMMMEATINRKKPEFEVRVRRTLAGGLEERKQFAPNIIVLDLTLPDSPNGDETLAAISDMRKEGSCVIAVSGFHDLKGAALAAGANDFMPKTIGENIQPFIDRINALIPQCYQPS